MRWPFMLRSTHEREAARMVKLVADATPELAEPLGAMAEDVHRVALALVDVFEGARRLPPGQGLGYQLPGELPYGGSIEAVGSEVVIRLPFGKPREARAALVALLDRDVVGGGSS